MHVTVIGTGYVGLVAGACLAETGNTVVCADVDTAKIEGLTRNEIPIYEPGLEPLVRRNQDEGRLQFTTDIAAAIDHGQVIFIAVGTPPDEDGSADLQHVLEVADAIGKHMRDPKVIVTKSTVPVGTAEKVRAAIARHAKASFSVCSNPEFLKEGAAIDDFLRPDRVVIGVNDEGAAETMRELYRPFVRTGKPVLTMDPESAELTKYAANAMLATRISFMNEIARLCEQVGADVAHVRRAIGADSRIGGGFLFPGIGYGGSCFPKDIQALLKTSADFDTRLHIVRATEEVNEEQKTILVPKILAHFGGELSGRVFGMWGLAFKPRTDDMREAPALSLIRELVRRGARIRAHDPEAIDEARRQLQDVEDSVDYCDESYSVCDGASALLLVTEWNEFREPDFERMKDLLREPVVFDGRNIYNPQLMREKGFTYYGIGRG